MSVKFFSKKSNYTELNNENYDNSKPRISHKSNALAHQELEKNGIVIDKRDSVFSGAALNLILGNIASPTDVTNVLETDAKTCDC